MIYWKVARIELNDSSFIQNKIFGQSRDRSRQMHRTLQILLISNLTPNPKPSANFQRPAEWRKFPSWLNSGHVQFDEQISDRTKL